MKIHNREHLSEYANYLIKLQRFEPFTEYFIVK